MRRLPLLLLFPLLACTTGEISLDDDKTGVDDTGSTDTAATDTGDPADTGDTNDSAASAWAGEWPGRVSLEVEAPNGQRMEICAGDATVRVADDGTFDGDGLCETEMGPGDIVLRFEGTIATNGAATGTAWLTLLEGEVPYVLTGLAAPGALELGWEGELRNPEGDEMPMFGGFEG